jgi:hypothetical protein
MENFRKVGNIAYVRDKSELKQKKMITQAQQQEQGNRTHKCSLTANSMQLRCTNFSLPKARDGSNSWCPTGYIRQLSTKCGLKSRLNPKRVKAIWWYSISSPLKFTLLIYTLQSNANLGWEHHSPSTRII